MRPYDPWAHAARHPDWEVGRAPLPALFDGIAAHRDGVTYLILRDGLTQQRERAALAEEIVHAERVVRGHALPSPDPRDPLNRREERLCRLLAALRLVGLGPIVQMIRELRCSGECNPWLYAEDLGVPPRLLLDFLAEMGRALGRRASRPEPYWQYEDNLREQPLSAKHRAWRIRPYFMPQWTG